jgi:hypothetical protein
MNIIRNRGIFSAGHMNKDDEKYNKFIFESNLKPAGEINLHTVKSTLGAYDALLKYDYDDSVLLYNGSLLRKTYATAATKKGNMEQSFASTDVVKAFVANDYPQMILKRVGKLQSHNGGVDFSISDSMLSYDHRVASDIMEYCGMLNLSLGTTDSVYTGVNSRSFSHYSSNEIIPSRNIYMSNTQSHASLFNMAFNQDFIQPIREVFDDSLYTKDDDKLLNVFIQLKFGQSKFKILSAEVFNKVKNTIKNKPSLSEYYSKEIDTIKNIKERLYINMMLNSDALETNIDNIDNKVISESNIGSYGENNINVLLTNVDHNISSRMDHWLPKEVDHGSIDSYILQKHILDDKKVKNIKEDMDREYIIKNIKDIVPCINTLSNDNNKLKNLITLTDTYKYNINDKYNIFENNEATRLFDKNVYLYRDMLTVGEHSYYYSVLPSNIGSGSPVGDDVGIYDSGDIISSIYRIILCEKEDLIKCYGEEKYKTLKLETALDDLIDPEFINTELFFSTLKSYLYLYNMAIAMNNKTNAEDDTIKELYDIIMNKVNKFNTFINRCLELAQGLYLQVRTTSIVDVFSTYTSHEKVLSEIYKIIVNNVKNMINKYYKTNKKEQVIGIRYVNEFATLPSFFFELGGENPEKAINELRVESCPGARNANEIVSLYISMGYTNKQHDHINNVYKELG